MSISWMLLLLGLAIVGIAFAVLLVAMSLTTRGAGRPHRDVMHCPHCRAVVSPLDRRCPKCDHPLKPQEIETLDPDAR
ncbi:MAG: zinc ribbon domain-containing protein [Planctomycetes bacterium]|nr:zinc ribbon domain-containing protein [Planctomycetota bacterium]